MIWSHAPKGWGSVSYFILGIISFSNYFLGTVPQVNGAKIPWRKIKTLGWDLLYFFFLSKNEQSSGRNRKDECLEWGGKVYYVESLGDWYPIRTNANRMSFGIFSKTRFSLSVILGELHLWKQLLSDFFLTSNRHHRSIPPPFPFASLIIEQYWWINAHGVWKKENKGDKPVIFWMRVSGATEGSF